MTSSELVHSRNRPKLPNNRLLTLSDREIEAGKSLARLQRSPMAMAEEEKEMNRETRAKVRSLIEKATNSTESEVDAGLLKAIKSTVRYSESELRLASQTLMDLMKHKHSQVRYLSLSIIDVLFMRSKLFRALIVVNLDQLLSLSVGFRRNQPLPPPASVATVLRAKAIEFLEKWKETYGIHYRQLRLGFDYLKNTLRFQFPNQQANAARIQKERREREMRTKEILRKKFEALKESFSSIKEEIQSTTDEIGECLEIVRTEDDNVTLALPLDDEDHEEFYSSELRQLRLASLNEAEKVEENNDNKVVFDALRELYKLLLTKHLVSAQEWISLLIRVEVDDNRLRDSMLKEFIDIRNHILGAKKKCEQTVSVLPDPRGGDDDVIWEEGLIESADVRDSVRTSKFGEGLEVASTSELVLDKDLSGGSSNKRMEKVNEGASKDSFSLRDKLLAEAPVIRWGSFLDQWGAKRDFLANQRGLELEGHWGRVDHDAVIPAEKIAELNVHATVYKEENVEIQPCRAPLRRRGLCQRRDLRVCPFHGPIVPRDDEGKPIYPQNGNGSALVPEHDNRQPTEEQHLSTKENPDMRDGLMEQLAKQAVKNVRQRDKDEMRKKEDDRKLLKRAKLAKVREHNEAVLREASLASTSRSSAMGEYIDAIDGERPVVKHKKPTLASMLRKKVTTKDRLSERLLSSRARDATVRQLTQGEDMNYREAFPNQW